MREEQQMEKKTEAKQIHLDQVLPGQIEAKSFEIIGQELQEMGIRLKPEEELVIKRAIHASADFDYAQNLVFSPEAVGAGLEAIRKGCHIVTDTRMACPASTRAGFRLSAGKRLPLCPMKMWRKRPDRQVPPGPRPAWKRRRLSTGRADAWSGRPAFLRWETLLRL